MNPVVLALATDDGGSSVASAKTAGNSVFLSTKETKYAKVSAEKPHLYSVVEIKLNHLQIFIQ